MKSAKGTVIKTTPQELRQIADLLERYWNISMPGEYVPDLLWESDSLVTFAIDADKMLLQENKK